MPRTSQRRTVPDPRTTTLATRAIHGRKLYPHASPVATPIVQTSTYRFQDSGDAVRYADGDPDVYVYSRYHNPTVQEAEERLALMMQADRAVVFSSGMAAITSTLLAAARSGDGIISTPGLYGGTYRFFRDLLPRHGVGLRYVRPDRLDTLSRMISSRTRVVYFETPTNPSLGIVDIAELVRQVRRTPRGRRVLIVADNTFATVLNQNPLLLGADVLVESATKYLGGHSDVIAGVAAGPARFMRDVHTQQKYLGGCTDPFAAFLLVRSLQTFELRVARQNENAMELARFLETHPAVTRVLYPGLPSHPGHAIARRQMTEAGGRGYGGMVTIEVRGGVRAAVSVCDALRIAVNAMSLGGVETLVSIPVYSSHIRMSARELHRQDVTPGMVRISVGIEGIADLKRDFAQALDGLGRLRATIS
jgi:cystathionine beta-lyase/cystathionine gamma-synthase